MKVFAGGAGQNSQVVFDTTQKAGWIAESLMADPIPKAQLVPNVTDVAMREVHRPEYIYAVQAGEPRWLAETNLFEWDKGLYPMAAAHVAGFVDAAAEALDVGVAGSLSSGFHHARPGSGAGYCTFNGLAIAAARLAADGKRVTIFDVDAHYGGGTYECVGGNPAITIVDLSTNRFDRWETQQVRHWVKYTTPSGYMRMVAAGLERVLASKPDIVLYNAGMDPADSGVTSVQLENREWLVADTLAATVPAMAWCLAGGYTSAHRTQADLVRQHRFTIEAFAHVSV